MLLKYFILLPFLLHLTVIAGESETTTKTEEKKINLLLEAVEKSEAVFIRNGEEHPSKKARSHLEFKYNKAKNMFWFFGPSKKITAKEFIEKIASKSSTTGEVYKMKPKDRANPIPTSEWLMDKLKDIEKDLREKNSQSVSKTRHHND